MTSTPDFRGPDFVVGGAPKCGTTTLCDALAAHPGIRFADFKEPHYYITRELGRPVKGCDYTTAQYAELFSGRTPHQRTGEGSTGYLHHATEVAPALHADRPDCRLVFCIRDPVERVYSDYWFHLQRGEIPSAHTFDEVARDPSHWIFHGSMYTRNLVSFADHFGRDALLVVLTDDLRDDFESAVARVCAHVRVAPSLAPIPAARSNVTRYPRWPQAMATAGRVVPGLSRWAARTPSLRPFRSRLLFSEQAPKPSMDPDTRARLVERYEPEVEALSDFIGRDLSHWL